jgi:hypothetical protein
MRATASPGSVDLRPLARDDAGGAHSRYNALVRRLVSFERAAARERSRQLERSGLDLDA